MLLFSAILGILSFFGIALLNGITLTLLLIPASIPPLKLGSTLVANICMALGLKEHTGL